MKIRETCKPPLEIGIIIPICVAILIIYLFTSAAAFAGYIIGLVLALLGSFGFGWFSELFFKKESLPGRAVILAVSSIVSAFFGILSSSILNHILNCGIDAATCPPVGNTLLAGVIVGVLIGVCGWFFSWFKRCVV